MFGEIAAALWAELLKVRRSKVPWVTFVAFTMAGLVGGFFMFVLQDPDRARSLGLLGAKAQFTGGAADWAGYFALIAQIAAVGGPARVRHSHHLAVRPRVLRPDR